MNAVIKGCPLHMTYINHLILSELVNSLMHITVTWRSGYLCSAVRRVCIT
jgi:hypothetical protein